MDPHGLSSFAVSIDKEGVKPWSWKELGTEVVGEGHTNFHLSWELSSDFRANRLAKIKVHDVVRFSEP